MKLNLAAVSIKRPTFITSVLVVILIVGYMVMNKMSVDMFPDVSFPFASITTIYPGAGPQEMETLVSKILEDEVSSISGLKNVTSVNQDGVSIIIGEFSLGVSPSYAEQQMKDKVAQVRYKLPKDIMEPIVKRFDPADSPIMMLSLTAQLPPAELYDLADTTVKDTLAQVPNVGNVEIIGGTKREIHADLKLEKLKEYELSASMVSGRIAANSQNIPIGKIQKQDRELSFRSLGEFRSIKQIEDVVVSFFGNDVPITLKSIGTVKDTTQEVKTIGYLNRKPALLINVFKQSGSNSVKVVDSLIKKIDRLNNRMKDIKGAPSISTVMERARPIRINISDVKTTIFEGILLATLVVYLFLGSFRSTFITVMALPTSLIGAFIFMGMAGFSINMLTLMALSLAVGLLIDDAIVVRENIFRHIERGETAKKAAQSGTDEVTLAVIATSLTVIAVFLPVGFLQGIVGQFFKEFGLTVVFAMSISLFDALTIGPMLSAYLIGDDVMEKKKRTGVMALIHWPAEKFAVVQDMMSESYKNIMNFALRHKILVIGSALAVFIFSLFLVTRIPKTFMPPNEFGKFMLYLEAEPGISLNAMEKKSLEVYDLLLKEKDIALVSLSIGNSNGESNVASFLIELVPNNKRKRSTSEFKEYTRSLLKPYDSALHPSVSDIGMFAGDNDKPFNIILIGENLEKLASVANDVMENFKSIPKLVDISSNYKIGKPEFQIKFDPLKMEKLGVQSIIAGMELRNMVEGSTPAKYRENGMEYDIRVRLQDDQRDLSGNLNSLYVPNVNYKLVKLKNIAEPVITKGPTKILRRNRSRYVMVSGNLGKNGAVGDITAAASKIMSNMKLPGGITYEFVGDYEQMTELFQNMSIAMILSVIFIYFILASLYESLIIPFTIMVALPMAIIGALIALFVFNQSLNIFTMIGMIMLLGIVTKNSILLVDLAQRLIRSGIKRDEAIIKAGLTRLRPILMTTFTLIAGMTPIALGLSETGKQRMGMGIAIIGGLISSTILTLVIIPSIFGSMDQFRMWTRKLVKRPELREIDKEAI